MKGCRPLSDQEIRRIGGSFAGIDAARDRALFVLGHRTGFRIQELLSLRVGDCLVGGRPPAGAISAGHVAERITVARRHMKRKQEGRTVPVHHEARAAVAAWLEQLRARLGDLPSSAPLFVSRKPARRARTTGVLFGAGVLPADAPPSVPTRLRAISRQHAWCILHRAFARASVLGQTGTHSMRKTFALRVYERCGRDLITVQDALGHRNVGSTASYLAARRDDVDKAILGD